MFLVRPQNFHCPFMTFVLAFARSDFSTKLLMYSYFSLIVCFALFLFTPSSSFRIPEYATRVRTEYRFQIPKSIPTGPWHTAASSSTPTSVSQDSSTLSDYSQRIIQTDDYIPTITGLVEASSGLLLLNSLHITTSDDRDDASSISIEPGPMTTDGGLMSTGSVITDLPRGPTVTSKPTLSSTASARVPDATSSGACSQTSIFMVTIWGVVAGVLMSQL